MIKAKLDVDGIECDFALDIRKASKQPVAEVRCRGKQVPTIEVAGLNRVEDKTVRVWPWFEGDTLSMIASIPLATLAGWPNIKWELPLEVTLTVPGHQPLVVKPPAWWVSSSIFDRWSEGVAFGTEPADDGKRAALYLHEGYSGQQLIGRGTRFSDLDRIVVQRDKQDGKRIGCGHQLSILLEATLTTYDRRTGAVLDEHPMSNPKASCQDRGIYLEGTSEARSGIPFADVKKYVEAKLAAP